MMFVLKKIRSFHMSAAVTSMISMVLMCAEIFGYTQIIFIPIFESQWLSLAVLGVMLMCSNFLSGRLPCFESIVVNDVCYTTAALGLYTAFAYFNLYQNTLFVMGILFSVAAVILTVLCFAALRGKGCYFTEKLSVCAVFIVIVLGILSTALLSIISYNNLRYGRGVLPSSAFSYYADDAAELDEDTAIKEIRADLLTDDYKELTVEEKISLCQKVVNLECQHLNLDPVRIFTADIDDDPSDQQTLLGYYDYETNRIFVDCDTLSTASGEKILDTILHETFHVFQYELIDLYENDAESLSDYPELLKRAKRYSLESQNYENGSKSYSAYRNQLLEKDARAYADSRSDDYCFSFDETI